MTASSHPLQLFLLTLIVFSALLPDPEIPQGATEEPRQHRCACLIERSGGPASSYFQAAMREQVCWCLRVCVWFRIIQLYLYCWHSSPSRPGGCLLLPPSVGAPRMKKAPRGRGVPVFFFFLEPIDCDRRCTAGAVFEAAVGNAPFCLRLGELTRSLRSSPHPRALGSPARRRWVSNKPQSLGHCAS